MEKIVLFLPVLSGIMFGASGIFVRRLSACEINNLTILFLRVMFALLAMFIVILIYDKSLFKINLKDIPIFIGTGLIGMLGLNLCYNEALNKLTLSLAAVLLSTSPIFVMFFAAIIFKERITTKKITCMLLAIAGCILASGLLEQQSGLKISTTGILTGIAAAIFYALYSIFSRKTTDKGYHTYTVIFYSVLLITFVLLPFADPVPNIFFLIIHSLCLSD